MKRIFKNISAATIAVMLVFTLTSCSLFVESYEKYSYEFFGTFDTIVKVSGYAKSEKEFDKYSAYAYQRFNELNKLYDNYNTYEGVNSIKTINDNAGIAPVEADPQIIDLLVFCMESYEEISQKTDISIGAVLEIWHNYREEGLNDPDNAAVPPPKELQAANLFTGMENIVIDKEKNTVYLNEGTALDLGAVAKGYATELVARELYDMGFKSFFISSGGNVKAVGAPEDDTKTAWAIGLQNPFYFDDPDNAESLIDVAYANDMSVVTSGNYQRFYIADGVKYHHLIDPETLFPAEYFSAVTIFAEDSGLADFLSTAVFLTPYGQGRALIESMDGLEAYWVLADGTVEATEGAKELLKNLGGAAN